MAKRSYTLTGCDQCATGTSFSVLLSGPLTAHAEAQAEQAKAAAKFMKWAGLDPDKGAKKKE